MNLVAAPRLLKPHTMRALAYRLSACVVKWLERCFSVSLPLFRWYGDRFYRQVLARELALTRLQPGARVLHIGAGALPYTACFLARRGFHVDAVDHDPRTLACARELLDAAGVGERVRVQLRDGLRVDPAAYDAIWISLHVTGKEAILRRLMAHARPGCWIVYREPRSWLRLFYHAVREDALGLPEGLAQRRHRLGKKSVAIRVNEALPARSLKVRRS